MDLAIFLRGLIIGLSIAAPVGPIGVLCIRRTLADGRAIGFASGLGAATADAVYGAVAAFGLSLVTNTLVEERVWLQAGGGIFLCYLGMRTWMSVPRTASGAPPANGRGLAAAWASTFALTLTNPTTIISFAAIFAGLGLGRSVGGYRPASVMVLGVFLGSALWWLILSMGVGLFRSSLTPHRLRWVNRGSGAIIAAFGIAALLSLMWS
ncbi:MAG TPA: LysE family transporter [Methylomirabilota bacterium]